MKMKQLIQFEEALRLSSMSRGANSDVRIDYSKWSEEAMASPDALIDDFYSHMPYNCGVCRRACVYSAESQKYRMEVLKKRFRLRPALCEECNAIRIGLERERAEFIAAWAERRNEIRGNKDLLARWLLILETLPNYAGRKDIAKIAQLQKLIRSMNGNS